MPRSVNSVAKRARRKKVLKQAKGYFGRRKNVWTVAKNAVDRAMQYSYRDRRNKKRNFRSLWIQRINAGAREHGMSYSKFMGQLKANNFEVEHESMKDDAGIIVINTCGFIDNAKQESIDTILRYVEAKEEGLVDKVYVTGCLSERYKGDLEKEIPEVDAYFGTRELPRLLKTLKADYKKELVGERLLTTPAH